MPRSHQSVCRRKNASRLFPEITNDRKTNTDGAWTAYKTTAKTAQKIPLFISHCMLCARSFGFLGCTAAGSQRRCQLCLHSFGKEPGFYGDPDAGFARKIVYGHGCVNRQYHAHGKFQHHAPARRQVQFALIQHRAISAQSAYRVVNRPCALIGFGSHLPAISSVSFRIPLYNYIGKKSPCQFLSKHLCR